MDTHGDFVTARRSSLIEEFGGGATAETAVDRALARCRRGWSRLERTTDVEAHVRDLVTRELERPRRRRLTACAVGALALVAAIAVGVSLLPAPPAVRAETNRVPVPWFADGELHLADVVVSLPGAGAFAPMDDGVVIEDAGESLLRVEADGGVSDYDGAMPDITEPDLPAPYDPSAPNSQRLDVVLAPDGAAVHLVELSVSRHEGEIYLRQSETVRRLFLVCPDTDCTTMSRVVVPGADVRLH